MVELPSKLSSILNQLGIDAMHVDELPEGNETSDANIIEYADANNLIVLTIFIIRIWHWISRRDYF